jgi:hypothetical protein
MNLLTSRQRKLVYLAGIVALMFPIILLGTPASKSSRGDAAAPETDPDEGGGGKLAQLRRQHQLGESTLGDVDPSSATMNLVLVGLRGIAANQLWMQADENRKTKNWAQLKTNIESIILLQPHFIKVWEFQGWNLAYNVSAEWDLVEDKYYWIKEGAKFSIRGTKRNQRYPELYWWVGIILGEKISNHDAWEYMRKFFNPKAYTYDKSGDLIGDPEIRRRENRIAPDPDLNPRGIDNHLVAKSWFQLANAQDLVVPQHRMSRLAFRQRPARAQMSFAEMMMKEGRFNEERTIIDAWKQGLREWTVSYSDGKPGFGQELFDSLAGKIRLSAESPQELAELRKLDDPPGRFSVSQKRRAIKSGRNIVNYNFWKTRAEVEELPEAVQAHYDIFQGHALHRAAKLRLAIRKLESGLRRYAKLMKDYPELKTRDESVEEVMVAILAWQDSHLLLNSSYSRQTHPVPLTRPSLLDVWNAHRGQRAEYERIMRRGFRIQ